MIRIGNYVYGTQFRPEDDASDGEYEAMLRFGSIRPEETEALKNTCLAERENVMVPMEILRRFIAMARKRVGQWA